MIIKGEEAMAKSGRVFIEKTIHKGNLYKGPSIYDVRTEGRLVNWLILRINSSDWLREMRTGGEEGFRPIWTSIYSL